MVDIDKTKIISEIKSFLEGYNDDLKFIVNVETNPSTNVAECIIHEPNKEPIIKKVLYEPFIYMKDLSKTEYSLYYGKSDELIKAKQVKHGIKIIKLNTGNQKRLIDGYCYKLTSSKSFYDIINYLRDGGLNPYEKARDVDGELIKDVNDKYVFLYRNLYFSVKPTEQFFISTKSRLFRGFEEYDDVHKLTFDIETTGLRYKRSRIFSIGVRDNRGFETIIEVDKVNDDSSEIEIIRDFFNLIDYLKPAVICGFNSEEFDFEYILGRVKLLGINIDALPTGLKKEIKLKRKPNSPVKYGNTSDKYTATQMWGYSVIDILHAAKKTAAINSDIKETKLKYLAKFEKVAKSNRTYINGDDNKIGEYYTKNDVFLINDNNEYIEIPLEHQSLGKKLYKLQTNKNKLNAEEYKTLKKKYLSGNNNFIKWFKEHALPKNMINFITGKKIVKQYLLDDLWETESIDNLYNQSSFMLAKLVPTTYQRICTMGTASQWNLLLTTWSYENDLAIPYPDKKEKFSGGLARCFKMGYTKTIKKIDFASLYPMIQLEDIVFPFFDITGVMEKMLLYFTTTRNIYKKLALNNKLNNEEVVLLRQIDHDAHEKYLNGEIMDVDIAKFKIKQLPIKTLNNSLYGALGSDIAFNWSDNICASKITCTARLHLRHAIDWFNKFGLVPLLAVTDGINFHVPDKTNIRVINDKIIEESYEETIDKMWIYDDKTGVDALIKKFNKEEMKTSFMSVDDDGDGESSLNLSRINYATLIKEKDKKSNEIKEKIKLTGNTIKSKVMPEYVVDFIDVGLKLILQGKGKEFVNYYHSYAEDIFYKQIPLKKIANKNKMKLTIKEYLNRGNDKNGRKKAMQAHMELLIQERERIAEELFEKYKNELEINKPIEKLKIKDKLKLVEDYMPLEPELDSTIYYINTGYVKSHGEASIIKDKETGEKRIASSLISNDDLNNNPDMKGEYNVSKYLDAFNKRVKSILVGFDPEIREKILLKIDKNNELIKNEFTTYELGLKNFDLDSIDEAITLEEKEVKFWNKTGYDPRLIWNGFKLSEENKIYYEIYENALDYLNDLMKKSNKQQIKSINDKYEKGDLILIKNDNNYKIGLYNGIYVKIIREDIKIPKSKIELELEKKEKENEKKIEKLNKSFISEKEDCEKNEKFKEYAFEKFKKEFTSFKDMKIDELYENFGDEFNDIFNEFIAGLKENENNINDLNDLD